LPAIFLILLITSTLVLAALSWIYWRRKLTNAAYAELKVELLKTRIGKLSIDEQQNFWSFVWRALVHSENKHEMHQILGNLCSLIGALFPILVTLLEVLAPADVGRPSGIVLNAIVSASAIFMAQFKFQTYAAQNGRAAYMIGAEIQNFLSGVNDYDQADGYKLFYSAIREILDSDQTSFVGAGTDGNVNALANFIRDNNIVSTVANAPVSGMAVGNAGGSAQSPGRLPQVARTIDGITSTRADRTGGLGGDRLDRVPEHTTPARQRPITPDETSSVIGGAGIWAKPGFEQTAKIVEDVVVSQAIADWPAWQASALAGVDDVVKVTQAGH
jgi:hypothetical protein